MYKVQSMVGRSDVQPCVTCGSCCRSIRTRCPRWTFASRPYLVRSQARPATQMRNRQEMQPGPVKPAMLRHRHRSPLSSHRRNRRRTVKPNHRRWCNLRVLIPTWTKQRPSPCRFAIVFTVLLGCIFMCSCRLVCSFIAIVLRLWSTNKSCFSNGMQNLSGS